MRGRAGKVTVLRDARRGMYLVEGGEGANRAINGHDVVLTIDAVVQYVTERALAKAVARYDATAGSAIVMDARTGAIEGDFRRRIEERAARERRQALGIAEHVAEPGSTFKIVGAAAGLEERVVTPSQVIDCGDGYIRIADVEIHEHNDMKYGLMSFEDVVVHSSNVGLIRVAMALGEQRLYRYIRSFGFGERTGITLPGEAAGLLRRTNRWSQVSAASISIGMCIVP